MRMGRKMKGRVNDVGGLKRTDVARRGAGIRSAS